jgi:flagellar motor switch/type III secretory pathway protein FliN
MEADQPESAFAASQLAALPCHATVVLARRRISVGELCNLRPGSVLTLDVSSKTAASLIVQHRQLATGDVVRRGNQLGFRLKQLSHVDPR